GRQVRGGGAGSVERLRRLYARARPQFLYPHPEREPRMDVLLGFGERLHGPPDGRSPGPPWTDAELAEIREELSRVHEVARDRMVAESAAAASDAGRAL